MMVAAVEMLNALDVGNELSRYMAGLGAGEVDSQYVHSMIDLLVSSRSETAADALALTTWTDILLREALVAVVSPEGIGDLDLPYTLGLCSVLVRQAIQALEQTSGLATEGFTGQPPQRN